MAVQNLNFEQECFFRPISSPRPDASKYRSANLTYRAKLHQRNLHFFTWHTMMLNVPRSDEDMRQKPASLFELWLARRQII